MSAAPSLPPDFQQPDERLPQEPPRRPPRALWKRVLLWTGIGLGVLVLLVVVAVEYVLHSQKAHDYILRTAQQKATESLGSNVSVGNYALNFSGISPTLDLYDVVIAGGPPYQDTTLLRVDHIRVGVQIVSLLSKKWYLSDVVVGHPVAHVFVDKEGKTNLPQPKSSGEKSGNTNLFDLGVRHALLDRGEVYYNNRKSVMDADLHAVNFQASFDGSVPRYFGKLAYENGHLKMETYNTIGHDFRAEFEYTPNRFVVTNAVLRSGSSHFTMNATLDDFTNPRINAEYIAALETGEFRQILQNPTLPVGRVDLNGKVVYVPQPNRPMMEVLQVTGTLASKALQVRTDSFRGEVRNIGANYALKNGNVDVSKMHAIVLGGDLNGAMTMKNIAAGAASSHLTATLRNAQLSAVKGMVSAPALKNVGLTGTVNADADATWGKTFDNLVAKANATIKAGVTPPNGGGQTVPVDGVIHANYSGASKNITLANSYVRLPQTTLNLNGTVSERSSLQVNLQANDLHELESVSAMFQEKPQPLGLYGAATFNGSVTGSTAAPHLTGQLSATNLKVRGTTWRMLRTNVDASPSQAALRNGELDPVEKGKITFDLRTGLDKWAFTKNSRFDVAMNVNQLNAGSLLQAAGVQTPVAGTLNVNVKAQGTQLNPVGNGTIELVQAKVAGEPLQNATVKFQGTGDVVHTTLALRLPAGSVNGNIDYFPKQEGYDAKIQSSGIRLEQLQAVKAKNLQLQGVVNINASGRGTVKDPQMVATVQIPQLVVQGQKMEGITLQTNVANHVANVALDSKAINTTIRGRATVNLTGNYDTVANLDTQAIPFAPLVAVYAPAQAGAITGQTELHATLRGPLKNKEAVEAHIVIPTLAVNYKNTVQIGAPQPIKADYANGVLVVQRSSLKGTATDLQFEGRIPVVDKNAPVRLALQGTVNLQLAQLLNPDVVSSGQLQFDINSIGQRSDPNIQGQIRVVNAAFASGTAPLGLQNGNGVLVLTRDRLDIQKFEGTVGGGTVVARGGVRYRPSLGFDLAMTADNIRLMYPDNIRSGLGAAITLSGTPENSYLRGTVNVDQVSFTPDFDMMELMGQFGGVSSPPPVQGITNDMNLDLAVRTPQGINLVSRELSLAGNINLRVRGTAAEPVILGRINLSNGDLIFRGNRYLLQGSTVDFVNPSRTQPVVNTTINTTIQQYNIAMKFEGPIDRLRTSYNSDPALPPADIINLLAFGKTTEAAAANPNPAGSFGAQSAIASAVAGQVTNRLQKVAGISYLSINPTLGGSGSGAGSNPGAVVTIQQRVTGKVFVTFSTDVTGTQGQTVQMEYRVSPRLSVSGTRDQNGGFAFDTRIRKQW